MSEWVPVCGEGGAPILICAEDDGTLLLTSITDHFPGTTTLKYRSKDTNAFRRVKCQDGVLSPPSKEFGWEAAKLYICVNPEKKTLSKGSRKAFKKSVEVEYADCGICIAGLVTYPNSIDDSLSKDCDCVFLEHFEMFLRKQKDKNTAASPEFEMKNEQRLSFAIETEGILNGTSKDCSKVDAYELAKVGELFFANPKRWDPKWADDLLEGFDEAEALIGHFKDLANDFGLQKITVKKDLVISGRRWVVEQLNVALEEFKEFRDGLDEKERKKYDKLVKQQNDKWFDFESEILTFEELDVIIKEIQKEMDDIIARHDNQKKDIDFLVELIEGKKLGAIPKKKEKMHKSKKKKNLVIKCKSDDQHFENANEQNITTQKSKEIKPETFPIDIEDFKSKEASLADNTKMAEKTKEVLNITKAQVKETRNQLREETSYEASLSDNIEIADELKKTKEVLNITKAQVKDTRNHLGEEISHEASLSDNTEIVDELKKTKEALNIIKAQLEETKKQLKEEKSHEPSLSDNTEIADELKRTKEALNITKAQLEETKNHLREEKLKNDHLNNKNDFLRSKLLHNDFKKYRNVLRQREKNNFSVIGHLRASPELEHTPQIQLALRSLHEFSARLLLADQQLTSQYDILYQQSQTSETIPELHFDMANVEPPDLGSSCINLLYRSILMSQSSPAPLPTPSTSSPLGSSLPTCHPRDRTQSSRVAGPVSSAMPSVGRQGTGLGPPSSLVPTGSVASFPSNEAAAARATSLNFKPRAAQITKLANKKVERDGGGASINTEDESCSICFEEMHSYDSFYLKSCRHRFHTTCLKQWLKSPRGESSTCPMCRTYIAQEHEFVNLGAPRRF